MKVTVAKIPGSRAVQVSVQEGATILDVLNAASMADSLNDGFEIRCNNSPATLSDTVSENAIITLASKISGNAAQTTVVHIAVEGCQHNYSTFIFNNALKPRIIFDDAEVRAFILSTFPDAPPEIDPEDFKVAIFKKGGEIKHYKCTGSNFMSSGGELYAVVYPATKDFSTDEDAEKLYDAYFTDDVAPSPEPIEIKLAEIPGTINVIVEDSGDTESDPCCHKNCGEKEDSADLTRNDKPLVSDAVISAFRQLAKTIEDDPYVTGTVSLNINLNSKA